MVGEQQHLLVRPWDVVGPDQTLLGRQGKWIHLREQADQAGAGRQLRFSPSVYHTEQRVQAEVDAELRHAPALYPTIHRAALPLDSARQFSGGVDRKWLLSGTTVER